MSAIDVDVWVDVVCPWCYLGKRRLEQAIAESAHPAEVTVTYHAFELDPRTPVGGGVSAIEHLAQVSGVSLDEARTMAEHTAMIARPDGIDIEVDRQVRANSFDAHRLIALGLAQGGHALQAAVLERFFSAHFSEGKPIDDIEALQRLGAEAGLDGRRVSAVLAADDFADLVRADQKAAQDIGITSVPFALANRRVAVSGAQPVELFGQMLGAAMDDGHRSHATMHAG
jgi:predicted DsbA family dithiol-disulfide isomerase